MSTPPERPTAVLTPEKRAAWIRDLRTLDTPRQREYARKALANHYGEHVARELLDEASS